MGIVLINGPFGIGKSTVAELLAQQAPETALFDPETVGTYLAHTLGRDALGDDYQDLPLWRHLFVDIALRLQQDWQPDLIIPMNLWRYDYFSEIVTGLGRNDTRVTCFRFTCSPDTLRARILARPDADGRHDWCMSHMESGLAAANDPRFGIAIDTESQTPEAIADRILALMNDSSGILRDYAYTKNPDPDLTEDWTAGYIGRHAKHRRYYSPAELRELAEIAIAEQVWEEMQEIERSRET